jgi:hypothetical protein
MSGGPGVGSSNLPAPTTFLSNKPRIATGLPPEANGRGQMPSSTRISRSFHWIGLLVAGSLALVIVGVAVIDFVHLRLWDAPTQQLPMIAAVLFLRCSGMV